MFKLSNLRKNFFWSVFPPVFACILSSEHIQTCTPLKSWESIPSDLYITQVSIICQQCAELRVCPSVLQRTTVPCPVLVQLRTTWELSNLAHDKSQSGPVADGVLRNAQPPGPGCGGWKRSGQRQVDRSGSLSWPCLMPIREIGGAEFYIVGLVLFSSRIWNRS